MTCPLPRGRRSTESSDLRWRRSSGLAGSILVLATIAACVTTSGTLGLETAVGGQPAYRALFRVQADGPKGRSHFKLAAALQPPERLRLEVFGPAGGARLVIAVDGKNLVAIAPAEKGYEIESAGSQPLGRLLGLPLEAAHIVALLTGRPMCPPESVEQRVETKLAAAFGRTVAWYEVSCPPDDIRYQARCQDRGGILSEASVRDGLTGAMILEAEYEDYEAGPGPRWPRRIRIRLSRDDLRLDLTALEGPVMSTVASTIFAPPVPDGFEKRQLLGFLSAPGLLGPSAERER